MKRLLVLSAGFAERRGSFYPNGAWIVARRRDEVNRRHPCHNAPQSPHVGPA